MIEDRIAERFRSAVAGEPPLGFDPDDVVSEAGRRQRHRRAVAGTTVATIGVAVAAVAVFAVAGTGANPVEVGSGPSSAVSPTGGPTSLPAPSDAEGRRVKEAPPPSTAPPTFPGSDNVAKQLAPAISAVLRDRVPGLRFNQPDGGDLMVVDGRHGLGGAYLAAGTKHRYVSVWVYHDSDHLDLAGDPAAGGGWGPVVSDTTQQDGSHVRVYRFDDGSGTLGLTVVHLRTDGVIVQADTDAKPEPNRTGLAVNQQQLTAIATDPRLTF